MEILSDEEQKRQRIRYAINIFCTVPASGLFEICERIADHLGIDKDEINMALLKTWDEIRTEPLD